MAPRVETVPDTPVWPTRVKAKYTHGRVRGVDNSTWAYFSVPLGPIAEAKTTRQAVEGGSPLFAALSLLTETSTARGNRRIAKSSYRDIHILLVNSPTRFRAPEGNPMEGYLNESYPQHIVQKRDMLLGVRLRASTDLGIEGTPGSKRWFGSVVDSIAETLASDGGAPIHEFDKDFKKIESLFLRAGLAPATPEQLRHADSWWGDGHGADVPVMRHSDHLNFFASMSDAKLAERLYEEGVPTRLWSSEFDEVGRELPVEVSSLRQHAVTFASVLDFDMGYKSIEDPLARWAAGLADRVPLRAISIRGLLEPAAINRNEAKNQIRQIRSDIDEAANAGKLDRTEQSEKLAELSQIEALQSGEGAVPVLVDASVLVAFDGEVEDIHTVEPMGITLAHMDNRQPQAWQETMIGSTAKANPHLHDLPITTVAFAGLQSLSQVGDYKGDLMLLGFTERDTQPAWLNPVGASAEDLSPIMLVAAATGAGKTVVLQWLADQSARLGRPTVIIDPKPESDLSSIVNLTGGQIASLDDIVSADGVFDPVRFSKSPQLGLELAVSMLIAVNPWGGTGADQYAAVIQYAIDYGIKNGAVCTGQAIKIAEEAGQIDASITLPIWQMLQASPLFRACFGMDPSTQPLSVSNGITLIRVGHTNLELPDRGEDIRTATPNKRVAAQIVRMMLFGSMAALTGRGGVLHLDESWIIEKSSPTELERVGRLARSMNVLPVLYTQTPSGPVNAGLTGYISRGLIGHIRDEKEARAALRLFDIEETPEIMNRITALPTIGAHGSVAPNYESLRALRDPRTGKFIRGSVMLYSDLNGRVSPVEISLPPEFLRKASTTPEDVARRNREDAIAREQAAQAAGSAGY